MECAYCAEANMCYVGRNNGRPWQTWRGKRPRECVLDREREARLDAMRAGVCWTQ